MYLTNIQQKKLLMGRVIAIFLCFFWSDEELHNCKYIQSASKCILVVSMGLFGFILCLFVQWSIFQLNHRCLQIKPVLALSNSSCPRAQRCTTIQPRWLSSLMCLYHSVYGLFPCERWIEFRLGPRFIYKVEISE